MLDRRGLWGTSHAWHKSLILYMLMISFFFPFPYSMEILACMYFMIDVALFWSMTKHKGRKFGIDEMLRWRHWVFDFT